MIYWEPLVSVVYSECGRWRFCALFPAHCRHA